MLNALKCEENENQPKGGEKNVRQETKRETELGRPLGLPRRRNESRPEVGALLADGHEDCPFALDSDTLSV